MSKTTKFNLKDYNTGIYNVETFDGNTVEIVAIDEKRFAVFGFYGNDNNPTTWDLEGAYLFGTKLSDDRDLVLRPKRITVHINITRTKSGKIDSYCSTKRKATVKAGGVLLKYMTVDIEA